MGTSMGFGLYHLKHIQIGSSALKSQALDLGKFDRFGLGFYIFVITFYYVASMTQKHFFRVFSTLFVITVVVLSVATPILYGQLKETVINLNLEKNKEQAERIATLVSIDLEKGVLPSLVLNKVQYMLENTLQSNEHFACIVENENKVIAHPKPSNINKDVTGWVIDNGIEIKTYSQSSGEGVPFGGLQTRLDGSQDITYQVPVSTQPWSVCVHTKLAVVEQQARELLNTIGIIIIPALLIMILSCSFILTRRVDRN